MAGYENIKEHGFDKRTAGERRELAKRAGKKSGEVRRRKADFNRTLNQLLTTKIDSEEWTPLLEALGLDSTLESAMLMSMIKAALEGDVKAANFVAQYAGQANKSELDLKEQELDIDRKKAGASTEHISIDDSIKEMEEYFEQQKKTDS